MSIPGLERWLDSRPGRHVLGWEGARIDGIVADIFGYNALQLGMPELDLLRENRIPFRRRSADPVALPESMCIATRASCRSPRTASISW